MKAVQQAPVALLEYEGESGLPPVGGAVIAVSVSLAFWGALLPLVL